jgi:hypothetical protein
MESTDKSHGTAEHLESAKERSLKAQKEGTAEWTPELSSDSEAAVCIPDLFFDSMVVLLPSYKTYSRFKSLARYHEPPKSKRS